MKNLYVTLLALLMTMGAFAQNDTIRDRIGGGNGGTVTWNASTNYYLDGYVFVESGDTLIIEPGTVIRGIGTPTAASQQGSDTTRDDASALIVAQGGYINASGTSSDPIIFTADQDQDLNSISDVTAFQNDLWGGVIILGNAGLNTNPGQQQIEGIPSFETRAAYGADDNGNTNDADNSGILRYISIRHGGNLLGQDNEINGLTLGGVGSGTTMEYIEIFSNLDDGIEWFGGTVNSKYIASAFVGDDGFDYDQGFRGQGQFWFVIQRNDDGGEGGEFDGGTSPENGMPFATPQVVNATFIGRGLDKGNRVMRIRDNAGGFFHNNIFSDFRRGVEIEIRDGADEFTVKRARQGDLAFKNNIFWNTGSTGTDADAFVGAAVNFKTLVNGVEDPQAIADSTAAVAEAKAVGDSIFTAGNNSYSSPGFVNVDSVARDNDASQSLDPRAFGMMVGQDLDEGVYDSTFFTPVTFKGAFSPDGADFWVAGWTGMQLYGFLPTDLTSNEVEITANIEVYPNPTSGFVTVSATEVNANHVEIVAFDLQGRKVYTEQINVVGNSIQRQIDFSNEAAGMYYVTLKADEFAQTFKVVVE